MTLDAGVGRMLYDSRVCHDLTIVCGSYEHKVYRCVISVQSKVLVAIYNSDKWKEGREARIELKARNSDADENEGDENCGRDDPEAVRYMIEFLYLQDYEYNPVETASTVSVQSCAADDTDLTAPRSSASVDQHPWATGWPQGNAIFGAQGLNVEAASVPDDKPAVPGSLTMHARIYILGDKYEIPALKSTAFAKIIQITNEGCFSTDDFIDALEIILSETPDTEVSLRTHVVAELAKNLERMWSNPRVPNTIEKTDGLAYALIEQQLAARTKSATAKKNEQETLFGMNERKKKQMNAFDMWNP